MPYENILILGITKMVQGVCLAGISQTTPRWVRPVRQSGPVSASDLVDRQGRIMQPLDIVTFHLLEWRPQHPHVEDWIADFQQKPVIKATVPEAQRTAILENYVEDALDCLLEARTRSLCLIAPDAVIAVSFDPGRRCGKYEVRVQFVHQGQEYGLQGPVLGYPCTDLRLRAWGRALLTGQDQPVVLTEEELRQHLKFKQVYLALGLGREYLGRYWPLIGGFLTVPDYQVEIDWNNL